MDAGSGGWLPWKNRRRRCLASARGPIGGVTHAADRRASQRVACLPAASDAAASDGGKSQASPATAARVTILLTSRRCSSLERRSSQREGRPPFRRTRVRLVAFSFPIGAPPPVVAGRAPGRAGEGPRKPLRALIGPCMRRRRWLISMHQVAENEEDRPAAARDSHASCSGERFPCLAGPNVSRWRPRAPSWDDELLVVGTRMMTETDGGKWVPFG